MVPSGTCQEIVYATYARVLGIPLDGVSVRVEGRLDPRGFFGAADVPCGFMNIDFDVDVASPAGPEAIGRLVATVNAHCPVLDILRQPVPVRGHYTLNGTPVSPAARPEPVLPDGTDERAVVGASVGAGVGLNGVTRRWFAPGGRGGLIFGYGTIAERDIEPGIRALAGAIDGLV